MNNYHDTIEIRKMWLAEAERIKKTPVEDSQGNPISWEQSNELTNAFYKAAYYALCGSYNPDPTEHSWNVYWEKGELLLKLARERIWFEERPERQFPYWIDNS